MLFSVEGSDCWRHAGGLDCARRRRLRLRVLVLPVVPDGGESSLKSNLDVGASALSHGAQAFRVAGACGSSMTSRQHDGAREGIQLAGLQVAWEWVPMWVLAWVPERTRWYMFVVGIAHHYWGWGCRRSLCRRPRYCCHSPYSTATFP